MTATTISTVECLGNEVQEGNKQQSDDKLSKPPDILAKNHNDA